MKDSAAPDALAAPVDPRAPRALDARDLPADDVAAARDAALTFTHVVRFKGHKTVYCRHTMTVEEYQRYGQLLR